MMTYFTKLLRSLIYYFDGEITKIASNDYVNNSKSASDILPCLVVNRRYYSEELVSFPITEMAQLQKVLKLRYSQENYSFFIAKVEDSVTWVNVWQFHDTVPLAHFRIPESLLVAQALNEKAVVTLENETNCFIAKVGTGCQSTLSTRLINKSDIFATSIGFGSEFELSTISHQEFVGSIPSRLQKMKLKAALSCFKPVRTAITSNTIISYFTYPVALILAYYLFLSAYLFSSNYSVNYELEEYTDSISEALSEQSKYDDRKSRLNDLKSLFEQYQLTYKMWHPIEQALQFGELKSIRNVQGRTVIRGSTESAVLLLEALAKLPQVLEAKFDSPTRTVRGKEQYVIGIIIDNSITVSKGAS
ncbi:hypothetical protein ACFSJY_18180 [Thalassotalea euphylliae]|uniref:hypothetical protein n=1 Tax=Thalassotalea euphylliae TaxID=1655234 RepID=UPI003639FBB2